MYKKNIIDTKIVGHTYRKNNHAGLAYQLITFPSLVRTSAINVHENIHTNHDTIIAPVHSNKCSKYTDLFTSELGFIKFNLYYNYITLFERNNVSINIVCK